MFHCRLVVTTFEHGVELGFAIRLREFLNERVVHTVKDSTNEELEVRVTGEDFL